jgi:basic amino acid/polyamine antiporter, APA family
VKSGGRGVLATKPVEALLSTARGAQSDHLERVLGPRQLVMLGIGDIIGAGIFVLTGLAAARYAGPAIVVSFLIAAVACGFAGLCYSEYAAMIPVSGSAYTYAYATLGELVAFLIGSALTLEFALGPATVAVGWSGYVSSFLRDFGIVIPPALLASPGTVLVETAAGRFEPLASAAQRLAAQGVDPTALVQAHGLLNVPALVAVLATTAVVAVGIRESARLNALMVVIKVSVVVLFVAVGIFHVRAAHFVPFLPPNTGEAGRYGVSGIVRGAAVVFFAYMGFDSVSAAAQEARRPERDLPIGILGSLGVCAVLYVLVACVLTGVVSYTELDVPDPFAVGVDAIGVRWLRPLVKLGAIAGLSSVMLVGMLAQTRIAYTMAQDGLLPRWVGRIHPRFKTPFPATLATGLVMGLAAAVTPIAELGELASIGTLFIFAVVCAGIPILRRARPDLPRPFRTPGSPFVPGLGVLACTYLMFGLSAETWGRFAVWLALAAVFYSAYGRRHSVVRGTH